MVWRQENMEDRQKASGAWWRRVVVERRALVKNTAREKKNWGPEAAVPYLGTQDRSLGSITTGKITKT
jgi:hypothetical protein